MQTAEAIKASKQDKIVNLLFLFIILSLLYCVWLIYKIYIFSFFIALISYLILQTPYTYLLKLLGHRKNIASIVATICVITVIIVPIFFLIQTLVKETFVVIRYLQSWLTKENWHIFYEKNKWMQQILLTLDLDISSIRVKMLQMITSFGSTLFNQGRDILSGIFMIIFNFIISIATLFFLFRDGDKIPPFIYSILPFPESIEKEIGNRLLHVLDIMVKGTGLISLTQGFMIGIYFWLFGLSTPILYGSIATIFSLVPVLGTMVVWLPATLYLYWKGYFLSSFLLSTLSMITYFGLENIVKPLFLDKKLALHPLFLFLAILGGVTEFGIKGFILGPFVVITFLIILEFMKVWNKKSQ